MCDLICDVISVEAATWVKFIRMIKSWSKTRKRWKIWK